VLLHADEQHVKQTPCEVFTCSGNAVVSRMYSQCSKIFGYTTSRLLVGNFLASSREINVSQKKFPFPCEDRRNNNAARLHVTGVRILACDAAGGGDECGST
jgi:hypothetical protein